MWNSEDKSLGICHLDFWRQNLGLQQEFDANFGAKSPPPPRPPNMEVPPGVYNHVCKEQQPVIIWLLKTTVL